MSPEGKYMTNAKDGKFYDHGTFVAYEGVTNRKISKLLMAELTQADIPCIQIHHDYLDVPYLSLITDAVNKLAKEKECIAIHIHSNAGKGNGFETFTSIGQDASDPIAEVIATQLEKDFPEWPHRQDKISDGDKDKEANFYVLAKAVCPSVLVELLFFDEIKQAEFLNSQIGQERLAMSLFKAIKQVV